METKHESSDSLFDRIRQADTKGWILLSESDLKIFNEIREIREIVLDVESPDFLISSRT